MRNRVPINSKRGEKGSPTPAPIVLPGVDITQASVQIMSLGGNTTGSGSTSAGGDANWTYPTGLVTGWRYTGALVNYNSIRYRKTGDGIVMLAGFIYNDTGSGASSTSPFFYLPVGYRPAFVAGSGAGSSVAWAKFKVDGGSSVAHTYVAVDSDGGVRLAYGTVGSGSILSLYGVTFFGEA